MEKVNVIVTKCKCVNVTRKNWDDTRKCFKYTLTLKPAANGDNVFVEDDLFAKEFLCPVTDITTRNKNAEKAASESSSDERLNEWDKIVSERYLGKETDVKHCTLSVSDLTDGAYQCYDIEIGEHTYNVASRNICALGNIDEAIARARNQVLRACKAQYEGEEA